MRRVLRFQMPHHGALHAAHPTSLAPPLGRPSCGTSRCRSLVDLLRHVAMTIIFRPSTVSSTIRDLYTSTCCHSCGAPFWARFFTGGPAYSTPRIPRWASLDGLYASCLDDGLLDDLHVARLSDSYIPASSNRDPFCQWFLAADGLGEFQPRRLLSMASRS